MRQGKGRREGYSQRQVAMDISSVDQQRAIPASTPQPVPPEQTAERQKLIQAVKKVNQSEMLGENNELTFAMDRNSRRPVVRVVNRQTNEVVFQIPPEYVLQMAADLKQGS
jgi:uncharacterized FlaG/YvyC family protein